jgi:uncharacterized protein
MAKRIVFTSLLCCAALFGQETPKLAHTVRASGEATISAKPDQAEVSVSISNLSQTAEAAAAQNATQTAQVLDSLKRALQGGGSLKTSGYSISAEYQYEQGKAPRLSGYNATNSVQVIVDNLALVGKIIDTATQSGANSIAGISFTLRDDGAVRSRALAQAALKARENAEAIANALHLRVVGILEAQTADTPVFRPLPMARMKVMAESATPIEAGTLDIHASVVVTLEVQ